ncbi:hypothetical protein, conserved [Plasmodium ovale curtisi]|uniref:Uncharacterized protein n=1 Tax=Plasmodium ovale curtisi TaxID=864141 RepID=A0A1A8VNC8_PLAOA|nr:hypothetical protein, conserved [Plasmodium ovale curtisi]
MSAEKANMLYVYNHSGIHRALYDDQNKDQNKSSINNLQMNNEIDLRTSLTYQTSAGSDRLTYPKKKDIKTKIEEISINKDKFGAKELYTKQVVRLKKESHRKINKLVLGSTIQTETTPALLCKHSKKIIPDQKCHVLNKPNSECTSPQMKKNLVLMKYQQGKKSNQNNPNGESFYRKLNHDAMVSNDTIYAFKSEDLKNYLYECSQFRGGEKDEKRSINVHRHNFSKEQEEKCIIRKLSCSNVINSGEAYSNTALPSNPERDGITQKKQQTYMQREKGHHINMTKHLGKQNNTQLDSNSSEGGNSNIRLNNYMYTEIKKEDILNEEQSVGARKKANLVMRQNSTSNFMAKRHITTIICGGGKGNTRNILKSGQVSRKGVSKERKTKGENEEEREDKNITHIKGNMNSSNKIYGQVSLDEKQNKQKKKRKNVRCKDIYKNVCNMSMGKNDIACDHCTLQICVHADAKSYGNQGVDRRTHKTEREVTWGEKNEPQKGRYMLLNCPSELLSGDLNEENILSSVNNAFWDTNVENKKFHSAHSALLSVRGKKIEDSKEKKIPWEKKKVVELNSRDISSEITNCKNNFLLLHANNEHGEGSHNFSNGQGEMKDVHDKESNNFHVNFNFSGKKGINFENGKNIKLIERSLDFPFIKKNVFEILKNEESKKKNKIDGEIGDNALEGGTFFLTPKSACVTFESSKKLAVQEEMARSVHDRISRSSSCNRDYTRNYTNRSISGGNFANCIPLDAGEQLGLCNSQVEEENISYFNLTNMEKKNNNISGCVKNAKIGKPNEGNACIAELVKKEEEEGLEGNMKGEKESLFERIRTTGKENMTPLEKRSDNSVKCYHDCIIFNEHNDVDEAHECYTEVNFINNGENEISSSDVGSQRGGINEREKDLCMRNDILVRDIEERKMGKLFFEEICIFRMNETSGGIDTAVGSCSRSGSQSSNGGREGDTPRKFMQNDSIGDIDVAKLELSKNCYEHLSGEVKNLMREEDTYKLEMNVGLIFRKYISISINLSCNYLLIKKNDKNVITCIPYSNIIEIDIVKKSKKKKDIFFFKLVYIFKKKEEKSEKNITLLFRSNIMEVYDKIKSKVEPISSNSQNKAKEYLDIETVYSYIVEKYKRVYILYLRHLLQIVEKLYKKYILKNAFCKLKNNCDYVNKMEEIKQKKIKMIQNMTDKLQFYAKKIVQNYFNVLIIKSYETSFVNYQMKTNDMLFNMLVKEKSIYQENIERQSYLLLYSTLSNLYKNRMSRYFRCFVHNNTLLSKRKNAFSYTLTHVNSILLQYERRIKCFVISMFRFNYDNITYFSFIMYKIYLRRTFNGYIRLRDHRLSIKMVINKNVYHLIKVIAKMVDNQKYYAFYKLQKYIFQKRDIQNRQVCDNLMYANSQLCNNLDKVQIEKGIQKMESVYKFKNKESLVKYFFTLKGPQLNTSNFNHYVKYCTIFSFVLNKILQRKYQNILFHFILKCFQHNNKSRLTHGVKNMELLIIKKEKESIMHLLKLYDQYPYLFKYRHMTQIEIFTISIDNFINFCNRKWLLNFLLKLHYLKYQDKFIKAYRCIGHIYNFVRILHRKVQIKVKGPFTLLAQNAHLRISKTVRGKLKTKKTQLKASLAQWKNRAQSKVNYNKTTSSPPRLLHKHSHPQTAHVTVTSPDSHSLMRHYPYLFYNSDISPDRATLAEDKISLPSNESVSNIFSYAYEDMDKIKRKIYDFNTRISNVN